MPRRQQRNRSSQPLSSHSDGSCSDSCFDEESEPQGSGSDTIATDVDSDVEIEDKAMPGITQEDDDHPPEYYRNLEEDPESDDEKEDYKEGSLSLIDGMEERFHRWAPIPFHPLLLLLAYNANLTDLQILAICREGPSRGDARNHTTYHQGLLCMAAKPASGEGWKEGEGAWVRGQPGDVLQVLAISL